VPFGGWSAFFSEWLASLDGLCLILLAVIAAFACLAADLLRSLRLSRLIPEALLEKVQDEMANGEYEKALGICSGSDSLIGQVFAAPLAKTDYPFARMEQAMRNELRLQQTVWRQWIGRLELAPPAGIFLGLMGMAVELMRFISELAGRPDLTLSLTYFPEMRAPLHNALTLLFLGLFLALASRTAAALCRARLDGIVLEAERLGEELLDSFRPIPKTQE
jgi:hypothetical protein